MREVSVAAWLRLLAAALFQVLARVVWRTGPSETRLSGELDSAGVT